MIPVGRQIRSKWVIYFGAYFRNLRNFFGGMFWESFLGRIFLGGFFGGFFWEEFFVYIGIDLFIKILSQWRRKEEEEGKNLDP